MAQGELGERAGFAGPIPDHIPDELIGDYPFVRGRVTTERPHDIAQRIQDTETRRGWFVPGIFTGISGWVFRGLEDNRAIAIDTEHFSNANTAPFSAMTGGGWRQLPNEYDPPEHAAYRKILSPLFLPAAVAKLDATVARHAENFVLAFRDRGECEFMADFAFKFPITIFMELMGLPLERVDEFLAWERELISGESYKSVAAASQATVDYLRDEIEDRRVTPRDDLIGYALNAEADGRKLNDSELLGLCFNLFVGGLDTVSTHMGFIFRHLAEHPYHQAELREHPERMNFAIDELMRAYGSSTNPKRCIKDVEIGEILIRAGEFATVSGPLSGRDREAFPDADVVRFDRRPRALSFGYGPHMCIGMHLAKRELNYAIHTMLSLLPEFSIAPGAVIESVLGAIPQPLAVPLVWH